MTDLNGGAEIRELEKKDAAAFRALRLRGLEETPEAFGSSAEEERLQQVPDWESRIENDRVQGNFVLGAFSAAGELVAVCGFRRETARAKTRHKGYIWGMYVDPAARGRGIGRSLLEEAIRRVADRQLAEQIGLCVITENTAAKKLYDRLGFTVYGVEPRALKIGARYYDEEHRCLMLGAKIPRD